MQGVDFTALRFFTVYGPRGRPDMMAYKIFRGHAHGCTNFFAPVQWWQHVPRLDVRGRHRLWHRRGRKSIVVSAITRQVINIGRGEPVLLADFIKSFEKLAGKKAPMTSEPMMKADVSYTFSPTSTKQNLLLDYDPKKVSVDEGRAALLYDWYKERGRRSGSVSRRSPLFCPSRGNPL